ncbi:FAD/NAD(P)-binding protein [Kluyvera genomosp. 1]|uniref:FAD/NAD(P)-binding protein n=1 Tax=Kluyvera genomosp. 1 TaxID=2774053 RepID=UPI00068AE646|nr:FAD/NAD(P)-binding protein [Kluyvera genomosp. 1]
MAEPHVVIVGGGFSGTAVAIHLMRETTRSLRISVIEPREHLGQGVAYSATDSAHRINVPAARMQLAGDDDGAFDRWYRRYGDFPQDPQALQADGSVYPQRGAFGRYVEAAFHQAAKAHGSRVAHIQERAVDWQHGRLITSTGQRLQADRIILAVSHPPPRLSPVVQPLSQHPRLIANPWQPGALADIPATAKVAIMGTALSMADVVASLARQGHQGEVLAFSRHGLLSRPNAPINLPQWTADYQYGSLRQRLRRIREDITRAKTHGLPWQVVLDAVRQQGQAIWQRLNEAEKRQFLRHVRRFWDVHRYRIAPQVAQAIADKRQMGTFRPLAARLQTLEARSNALQLHLTLRGGKAQQETVDYLVLTTGPDHADLIASQPFLQALHREGLIHPDSLDMGIEVNVLSQASQNIWVAGPAARGRFGELMGLPQVAEHAQQVAQHVLETLGCRQLILS